MAVPHKMTLDDIWALQSLETVAVSPDGRHVVLVIQQSDRQRDEVRSALYLLHLDESGNAIEVLRQLTSGEKVDSSPVWAPDNRRVLFLSNREGEKNQVWVIDTRGGEAYRLTNMLNGVSEAAWSPDGRWIALTAPVSVWDNDEEVLLGDKPQEESVKRRREEEARTQARTIRSLRYRFDGRGFFDQHPQVFLCAAPTMMERVGAKGIQRLTHDECDYEQILWAPDSEEIGVVCNKEESRNDTFITDIWAINRQTGDARRLTENNLSIMSYAWAPDGRSLVAVAMKDEITAGCDLARLYLVTRYGNVGDHTLAISPDFGLDAAPTVGMAWQLPGVYRPQWSQDSQQIYFLATERGSVHVYRLDVAWRSIVQLTDGPVMTSFLALLPGDGQLLITQAQLDHPWELYRLPLTEAGAGEPVWLTQLYDDWLEEIHRGKTEHIQYKGANGDEIDGFLIHPVGVKSAGRYPLLLQVHGGPHWGYGFELDPIAQYYAAQGYAVFYCNPHGSTGSGEEFMRSVMGDWGGKDFQDIMLGVDECIARGVADPERLVVTGYSYGGFMSMFIVGHTDRFKAAVPMAGLSDLKSFFGISDEGPWMATESLGYPWEPERQVYYREHSPLSSVVNVVTPTLLIHPENDLRCPIEESEQFYTALKVLGKAPVEMVRMPNAWHMGRSKPSQGIAYWERMLEWFGRYVEMRADEYD